MRLKNAPQVNETLGLPAFMGTAIHRALQRGVGYADPFGDRYLTEVEVQDTDGVICDLVGHVDLYDRVERLVVDWKTITKKKIATFPSENQRWQVQLYGHLMNLNNYPVDEVALIGIPRDGDERDIKVHREPYDENVVAEAFQWIDEVLSSETAPEPEWHARACALYCSFYDASGYTGCPGKK
jgi:CRISPR/Cas system-associated exonuclease Cas4 (RecB family)